MVRRSRLEILFTVLEVIGRGNDKFTRIMYRSNLSHKTLQEVMSSLIQNDFIKVEKTSSFNRYYITEKGKNALLYYNKSLEGLVITTDNLEI